MRPRPTRHKRVPLLLFDWLCGVPSYPQDEFLGTHRSLADTLAVAFDPCKTCRHPSLTQSVAVVRVPVQTP